MNQTNPDIIIANPSDAQQLFILLHDADEQPQDCLCLGQHLQKNFNQAAIIAAATPPALFHEATDHSAFNTLLAHWWQATGLDATCTALICQGTPARHAIHAACQQLLCARLFTVGDCLPHAAAQLPEHTTLHCLHPENCSSTHTIEQVRKTLHQADVDYTLDTLPQPCVCDAHSVQNRIVHLLQSHVPQRLWREAMRNMQAGQ